MDKPARGARNQQVARAGELFVAAELSKRGAFAQLWPPNTPRFDIVATDRDQRTTIQIQVKAKSVRSREWPGKYDRFRRESDSAADSNFIVFVDLGRDKQAPEYYVCPLKQVAAGRVRRHQEYQKLRGLGDSYQDSRITVDEVKQWRGCWDILGIFT